MRDYIFHGKREDNGEWVEGNLTVWNDGSASIDDGPTISSRPSVIYLKNTVLELMYND